MNEYDKALAEIKKSYPKVTVIKKDDSFLMKVINVILLIITFGQMKTFMTGFATTIGNTIYVSSTWEDKHPKTKAAVVRHEGIHVKQAHDDGMVLFALKYILWPVPVLFAKGRRDYEMEAYAETMRVHARYYGVQILKMPEYRQRMLSHFTSAQYVWTWPWKGSLNKWYDSVVDSIK